MPSTLTKRLTKAADKALGRPPAAPVHEDAARGFDVASLRKLPDASRAKVVAACMKIALSSLGEDDGWVALCDVFDVVPSGDLEAWVGKAEKVMSSFTTEEAHRLFKLPLEWRERLIKGEDDVRWRLVKNLDVSQPFTRPARVDLSALVRRPGPTSLSHVTSFDFSHTKQRAEDVKQIVDAPFAAGLQAIHASGNALGAEGVEALMSAPSLSGVEWWVLQDVGLDDTTLAGITPIFARRQTGAASAVDLAKNESVTGKGFAALVEALAAGQCPIRSLNVSGCPIGDVGAEALMAYPPPHLMHLGLSGTGISAAAQAKLRDHFRHLKTCWL